MHRRVALATLLLMGVFTFECPAIAHAQDKPPAETRIDGPDGLPIIVRMQGPYDADVPLQVVCYFQKTATSDAKLFGAPVELDKRLGGVIAALRERGEFQGDALETQLIEPPEGCIRPKRLLLIGLGRESELSLQRMQTVGRTALRQAARLGANRVAFAPLIKDAGNEQFPAGEVETAVIHGMLLAYDTEKRLQQQGFASSFRLDEWIVEAGPTYYDETIAGVKLAVVQSNQAIKQRSSTNYSTKSK